MKIQMLSPSSSPLDTQILVNGEPVAVIDFEVKVSVDHLVEVRMTAEPDDIKVMMQDPTVIVKPVRYEYQQTTVAVPGPLRHWWRSRRERRLRRRDDRQRGRS